MITNNPAFEDDFVRWLFTDPSVGEVSRSLSGLDTSYAIKEISEDFYNHYSFMFNIKLKKLKLLETLDR